MERLSNLLPVGPDDGSHHHGARRQATRYPVHAAVSVRTPRLAEGVVLNASAGGIRVGIDEPFFVGEHVELSITFADDRVSDERAEVVWSRMLPDGHLIGLRFLPLA